MRVVIICPASTHTALVSSPSMAVLHLTTYLPTAHWHDKGADWRGLAHTQAHHRSRLSDSCEGGEALRKKKRKPIAYTRRVFRALREYELDLTHQQRDAPSHYRKHPTPGLDVLFLQCETKVFCLVSFFLSFTRSRNQVKLSL